MKLLYPGCRGRGVLFSIAAVGLADIACTTETGYAQQSIRDTPPTRSNPAGLSWRLR